MHEKRRLGVCIGINGERRTAGSASAKRDGLLCPLYNDTRDTLLIVRCADVSHCNITYRRSSILSLSRVVRD